MPVHQVSQTFELGVAATEAWAFLSDLQSLLSCVPGVEQVVSNRGMEAVVRVRAGIGQLSKLFEVKVLLRNAEPHTQVVFAAESDHFQMLGRLDLESAGTATTRVRYALEAKPVSNFGKALLMMTGDEFVKSQAEKFGACVRSRLSGTSRGEQG